MGAFQNNKFRSAADMNRVGKRYRAIMNKHPFLSFGLPFLAVIIAGSFVLTPAAAVRYERHDRKVRQMTKEEELNVRRAPRKVDMREEYYVSSPPLSGVWARVCGRREERRRCKGEEMIGDGGNADHFLR